MALGNQYFKAIVKTLDGSILADGEACVSVQDRSVDFRGSFVPMFRMGNRIIITRMVGAEEAQSFEGEVYLSSPKLLRIVGVDEKALATVELEMAPQRIAIHGTVSPVLKGVFQLAAGRRLKFDAEIFSISLTKLRFSCTEEFEVGEELQVSTEIPLVLNKVVVVVEQKLLFGEDRTGYRCSIKSLPESCREGLINYLAATAAPLSPEDEELPPPPEEY